MKRHLLSLVVAGFIGGVVAYMIEQPAQAHAGSPAMTTFSSGQVLTAAALNDNFSHLHNTFTAGITNAHVNSAAAIAYSKLNLVNGILNADVNSSAAISYTKLSLTGSPHVSKAWADVANCAASPCTVSASNGAITAVTRAGTGDYAVAIAMTDSSFAAFATVISVTEKHCLTYGHGTTGFGVKCYDAAGALVDAAFDVLVFDNN